MEEQTGWCLKRNLLDWPFATVWPKPSFYIGYCTKIHILVSVVAQKLFFDFNTQVRCEVFKVKVMIMIYWLSLSLYAIFSEPQNSGETKGTTGDLPLVLSPLVWIPLQGIPAFRDFTIRDPLYFVIQFQASISWIPHHFMILKKKIKKKNFFGIFSSKSWIEA